MIDNNKSDGNSENTWRLYKDLSWTWRIISPPEDYITETEYFADLIRKNSKEPVRNLLNLGSGGGHSDYTLKRFFDVTGIDMSQAMIELAKDLNPEVSYHFGDFRNFRLNEQFDAVTGFDALSYNLTEDDLCQAFSTAYSHLRKGGVFLTFQENFKESFKQNRVEHTTKVADNTEITFIEHYYDPDEHNTSFECTFVYLIRRDKKLTVEYDRHLLGLFPLGVWEKLLKEIGFTVKIENYQDVTMYICIKNH